MTEQLIPEIEKWLALSSEATQPIPRDWWMNKPYKPHFEDNPPPEIENKEEDMEKQLFIDKEALREWEVRMSIEAVLAIAPKDEPKWNQTQILTRVFRTLTRVQVRKLIEKYDLREKPRKPPWENESNIKEKQL